jgi:pyridoxine 5-phosphate synthase
VTVRLGVNIDHVATLRQARMENYPSLVDAATKVLEAGADQITIHLREDRRHIQDTDVEPLRLITKKFGRPLNFELGVAEAIVDIAIATSPDWFCLVPEKREEQTTEGGIDLINPKVFDQTRQTIERLKSECPTGKVSLFLEASPEVLKRAADLPIEAVEIHTGEFARHFLHGEETDQELARFSWAHEFLQRSRLGCHAGHGLTHDSLQVLLEARLFEEYNIGHWIICQSLFDGLGKVVGDLKNLCDRHPL